MFLINDIILGLKHQKNILWAATHTKTNRGFYKTVVQDLNVTLSTLTHQINISLPDPQTAENTHFRTG